MGVFPISGFLVNPLKKKIVITPKQDEKQNNVKNFNNDVISANCDVIAIFSI